MVFVFLIILFVLNNRLILSSGILVLIGRTERYMKKVGLYMRVVSKLIYTKKHKINTYFYLFITE